MLNGKTKSFNAILPAILNVAVNFAALFFAKIFLSAYKNGCDRNSHIAKNENRRVKSQGAV